MSDELLPIEPFNRELYAFLTDEQFAEFNDNMAWVIHHATDIHGEPLTTEERNRLISQHNGSVRAH